MVEIDKLISKLQVYNYRIRINNYNIGSIHNIMINQFKHIKGTQYLLKFVASYELDLPKEIGKLLDVLNDLLIEAER